LVPHDMNRKPRSLNDISQWKGSVCAWNVAQDLEILVAYVYSNGFFVLFHVFSASEIQHFLLYFGLPVLKPFMHHEYFHHLALLSTAMWLLLKREITLEDIEQASDLLKSFCRLMKQYYGVLMFTKKCS
jgi:hypothetical protein